MRTHWRTLAIALAVCGTTVAQDVTPTSGFRRPAPPPGNCCPPAPLFYGPDGKPITPMLGPDGKPLPMVGPDGKPLPQVGPDGKPIPPGDANAVPPSTDAFSQAGEGGTLPSSSFAPAFFGDLIGVGSARFVVGSSGQGGLVRTPAASRSGGWKSADTESPIPMDRVYYTFNWYDDVARVTNTQSGNPAAFGVFRNMIGLEKTFWHERASIGLRLPFVDVEAPAQFQSLTDREFADMSIVTKVALVKEPCRVLSAGMVITVPTGQGFIVDLPNARGVIDGQNEVRLFPVVLQPYIGYWRQLTERIYFHSFNSIAVPTNGLDVTLLSNDIGLGFYLYKSSCDRFVQGIIPTVELHSNTPLTDRGARTTPIGFSDQLNATLGIYVQLQRSTLGWAVGTPLLGPRPYDTEMTVNYTLKF